MGISSEPFEKLRNYIAMCAMKTGAPVIDLQQHLNAMEEALQQRCGHLLDDLERLTLLTAEMAGGSKQKLVEEEPALKDVLAAAAT